MNRKTLLMDEKSTEAVLKQGFDEQGVMIPEQFHKMVGAVCIDDDLFITLNYNKFVIGNEEVQ